MYRNSQGNRLQNGGNGLSCQGSACIGKKAAGQFALWLLPGIAAGIFLAAVLSFQEYKETAEIIGAVMQSETLAEGLKKASGEFRGQGEEFLLDYGYRPMGKWGEYMALTTPVCILLFQMTGWIVFAVRYQDERRRTKRIRELTAYLRAVNSGTAGALCRSEDEFSHLEDELYKTVMELRTTKEEAVRNHEVLAERIADIAHQLKTPLTSMSLMTELMEEYQTSDTKEYYVRLVNQTERLKNLVSGLLSLAKLDSHGIVFQKEKLELAELLETASEPLKGIMEEKKITFWVADAGKNDAEDTTGNDAAAVIHADRQWTEEALLNVLKNCVEHTRMHGRITASYSQNPIYTELQIEDEGDGFSVKDLPHIFERFYRGKGAAKDNAGIGLALAKAVLEQENGHIHAENTADGHARFVIRWYHSGSR